MDDLYQKLLIALVSALAGALIKRAIDRPLQQRVAIAIYIEAICLSLEGMIESFKKNEVPHLHGRAFLGALEGFLDLVRPVLGEQTASRLVDLRDLARRAVRLDKEIERNVLPPAELQHWNKDASRMIGALRAVAAKLKAKM